MRTAAFTALALVGFAANSRLSRLALGRQTIATMIGSVLVSGERPGALQWLGLLALAGRPR